MKEILREDIPELDEEVLHGIVGAICAYTSLSLEELASLNLTMMQYASISPAISDMETLMHNKALGSYTRNLCILMYRLGQQNATIPIAQCDGEEPSQSTPS
jgi:hypothetical protein